MRFVGRVLGLGVLGLVLLSASPAAVAAPVGQVDDRTCLVSGDKVVSPARIRLGETVQVRLTLHSACPPALYRVADIVLTIDRSRSMLDDGKLVAAKEAARAFVAATDLARHRVAIVAFYAEANVEISFSQDRAAIFDAIDALDTRSGTNYAAVLDTAQELIETERRAEALPVIVLLGDGKPNRPTSDPDGAAIASADAAKAAGTHIFSIGLGSDANQQLLRQIASSAAEYYYAPDVDDLTRIYEAIALLVSDYTLRDLTLTDVLAADVALVAGTPVPAAAVNDRELQWSVGLVPAEGLEWVYQIKPQRIGEYPTNDVAWADYTDGDGQRRTFVFPVPKIVVLDPKAASSCRGADAWTVLVHSFPDSVGVSGSSVAGCNNQFDSGDWMLGAGFRLPMLTYELWSPSYPEALYRGQSVSGAGRVDERLYIRVCQPPPYTLKLVTTDLNGYRACPNSPPERQITKRNFWPLELHTTQVRFGFVR